MEDNSVAYERVAEQYSNASYWAIKFNNAGNGKICIGRTDASDNGVLESASAISEHQWVHVAFTNDGSTLRLFVDGALSNSASSWTQPWTNASSGTPSLQLGNFRSINGYQTRGYISNFRIVKGSSVYTSAFTAPTSPLTAITNTVLLCSQDNRHLDNSTNGYTATAGTSNPPKIIPFSPFAPSRAYTESVVGGSGYFGGSGNLLQIAGGASGDFILDDEAEWCVEFWVYMINPLSNFARVMQINNGNGWAIRFDATSGKIGIGRSDAGSTDNIEDPTALPSHQWTHFAFTNKNQSGTYHLRLFRNGAQVATTSGWTQGWTNYDSTTSGGNLRIAAYYNNNFPGIMYLGTTRLVLGDYIYDSTFTPPTAPLTSTGTETKLLLNFTDAEIIDNTMKNNIRTVNNAQIDTTVKKFGTGSIEFDGDDALEYDGGNALALETGPFTVEFFVYFNGDPNSSGTNGRASLVRSIGASSGHMVIQRYDGDWRVGTEPSPQIIATQSLSNQTWYYVAMTRDASNNLRLFIDGTQAGSTATSFTQDFPDNDFFFGNFSRTGGSSRALTGYLDEIRITKGVARYTSNFTAPTKAFHDK